MLKLRLEDMMMEVFYQPPSGGCVLKLDLLGEGFGEVGQPPSGGCVLKRQRPETPPRRAASRLQAAVC